MRRMVLEAYAPKIENISRLVNGKAREFNVSPDALYSVKTVVNTLYTQVFDSDLMSPEQRIEIEKRLDECFDELEKDKQKFSMPNMTFAVEKPVNRNEGIGTIVGMASFVGAVLTGASYWFDSDFDWSSGIQEILTPVIVVFIASLTLLITFIKFRLDTDKNDFPSKAQELYDVVTFENQIAALIQKAGVKLQVARSDGLGVDFIVNLKGKRVGIEVKNWRKTVSTHMMQRLLHQVKTISERENIDEVVIVLPKDTKVPIMEFADSNISLMRTDEFASYLKQAA